MTVYPKSKGTMLAPTGQFFSSDAIYEHAVPTKQVMGDGQVMAEQRYKKMETLTRLETLQVQVNKAG